jgi:hypothetical protein
VRNRFNIFKAIVRRDCSKNPHCNSPTGEESPFSSISKRGDPSAFGFGMTKKVNLEKF